MRVANEASRLGPLHAAAADKPVVMSLTKKTGATRAPVGCRGETGVRAYFRIFAAQAIILPPCLPVIRPLATIRSL